MSASQSEIGKSKIVIIAGPTGVGKTGVGLELARRWNSEIISADSMQVYRRLSVGTAKPTPEETGAIPYHLIDFLEPVGSEGGEQRFNAAAFTRAAKPIIQRLSKAGRASLIVGGTGLYLRALTEGLFEHPPIDPEVRAALERNVTTEGAQAAHDRLRALDPASAAAIHPHDRIRLVRALEIIHATGKTPSRLREEQHKDAAPPSCQCRTFVLNAPRRVLYERIDTRAERMFEAGLIEETRELLALGIPPRFHCMKALGYGAVAGYLEGRLTLEQALAAVQQSHRNYVKRQLTWFRRVKGAHWISIDGKDACEIADEIEGAIAAERPR